MLDCFTTTTEDLIPVTAIATADFDAWYQKQTNKIKNWLQANSFKANSGSICLLPDREGKIKQVFLGITDSDDFWAFGALTEKLHSGNYQIEGDWSAEQFQRIAIAWGLGSYRFTAYKKQVMSAAKLYLPATTDAKHLMSVIDSIFLIRDLGNTPAENMGPASIAKAATSVAIDTNGKVTQIIGEDLLKKGFEAIYTVGKGSACKPRLIDITWKTNRKFPTVILVGKGVCFDAGGLDIKTPGVYMKDMEKDMVGAANVLGLAKMIQEHELPINLRVLIPTVENMLSGSSYKPGDIIKTYSGKTVEVTNTDAEGRLILSDALALASEANPDLILDFATLTGAATVALGPEIAAMFTKDTKMAQEILQHGDKESDPIWQLPIYQPYHKLLDSDRADIINSVEIRYGGAITAALFLQEFIGKDIPWIHFDIPSHNIDARPGRPKGADAFAIRAVFQYLVSTYGN